MKLSALLRNIRFYVLCFSILLSASVYWYNFNQYSGTDLLGIKLTEDYGLIALVYLYFTLLASPFTQAFDYFPFKGKYVQARRGIGVSAFYFALLHSISGFLGPLGGIQGIGFLRGTFLWSIMLGLAAFIILTYMAFTSFDKVVQKMGFRAWKTLHRTIYLGGMLILIHIILIGSHFTNLSANIPQLLFYALFFLLILEAIRFDKYLYTKFLNEQSQKVITPQHPVASNKPASTNPLSNVEEISPVKPTASDPMVSFVPPKNVNAQQPVQLQFQLLNTPKEVTSSELVIIDHQLETFVRLNPTQIDQNLLANIQFPKDGRFHLYLNIYFSDQTTRYYQFTLDVGDQSEVIGPSHSVDQSFSKRFGDLLVSLIGTTPLGTVKPLDERINLVVHIQQINPGTPLQLNPIAGNYGSSMMINQQTFQLIPINSVKDAVSTSDHQLSVGFRIPAQFWPPIPGIYRIFVQFDINRLRTFDFTVKI